MQTYIWAFNNRRNKGLIATVAPGTIARNWWRQQFVVNKGYKDYVNVSKSFNKEEAETKEASKYYDRLKKAEKYLDNKRGFNANDPSWG